MVCVSTGSVCVWRVSKARLARTPSPPRRDHRRAARTIVLVTVNACQITRARAIPASLARIVRLRRLTFHLSWKQTWHFNQWRSRMECRPNWVSDKLGLGLCSQHMKPSNPQPLQGPLCIRRMLGWFATTTAFSIIRVVSAIQDSPVMLVTRRCRA